MAGEPAPRGLLAGLHHRVGAGGEFARRAGVRRRGAFAICSLEPLLTAERIGETWILGRVILKRASRRRRFATWSPSAAGTAQLLRRLGASPGAVSSVVRAVRATADPRTAIVTCRRSRRAAPGSPATGPAGKAIKRSAELLQAAGMSVEVFAFRGRNLYNYARRGHSCARSIRALRGPRAGCSNALLAFPSGPAGG